MNFFQFKIKKFIQNEMALYVKSKFIFMTWKCDMEVVFFKL